MLGDYFRLDSGRSVSIERVWVESTYGGILVGHPNYVSTFLRERAVDELKKKHGFDVAVLFPEEHILPSYRFTVSLKSGALPDEMQWRFDNVPKDLPLGYHWDLSFVYVCWFEKSLNGNLIELIKSGTRSLEWEKYAKNSSSD